MKSAISSIRSGYTARNNQHTSEVAVFPLALLLVLFKAALGDWTESYHTR